MGVDAEPGRIISELREVVRDLQAELAHQRTIERRISVDKNVAAELTGLSSASITQAHDRGDLIGHWLGSKRLYEPAELEAWIRSLPTVKLGS